MQCCTALAEEQSLYEFNSGFIFGSNENVNLQRFNKSGIAEGKYSVDVYTNGNWKGRYELNVEFNTKGSLGSCYTAKMLTDFGVSPKKLNSKLSKKADYCGTLSEWNSDADIKDEFNSSSLTLTISVPQIYLSSDGGMVPSDQWDRGIPALNLNYMGNIYNSHVSSRDAKDSQAAYVGLNAGLSFNGWLLKHTGNMIWQERAGARWNSNQTYLHRAIPAIRSTAVAGQFYTDGTLFDTLQLRGFKISTSDNMYQDGMTSYAPQINGVALSNALVTVQQDGNILYQTSVPPGPFSLNDVFPSGYGRDLEVTVKESDGSETYFSVPYSSISNLLRPGFTQYQFAVGRVDVDHLKNKPDLAQVTVQHGLNNTLSLYSGLTAFNDYQAYLVGAGVNTGFGALALDYTYATTKFDAASASGEKYRLSFNRQFTDTKTGLLMSVSRSSDEHYYDTYSALQHIDFDKKGRTTDRSPQKNDMSFTINQGLPDGFGNVYFTGRISDYWDDSASRRQFQSTYNNNLKKMSYSLSYFRVYSSSYGRGTDNQFSLNLSYPLGLFGQRSTLMSNTTYNDAQFGSTRLGVNGALDNENTMTYGLNTSVSNGGSQNIALNTSYRSSVASTSANYSQGEGYQQYGAAMSGSVIVHGGGATLTPNNSNTMVLIEAKGAEGASIPGSPGVNVDSKGYAIASYARPYRANTIEINPKGSAEDISFSNTSTQVAPYEGSVVKVRFDTKLESVRVFNVNRPNGSPLAFAANVTNASGDTIGVVGQGGQVFINNEQAHEAFIKWDGGQCAFTLENNVGEDKVCS